MRTEISGDTTVRREHLQIPVHNGVTLHADIHAPAASTAPVLVLCTPYGRHLHTREAVGWARRGVAMCVVDVRGCGTSSGIWRPYRDTAADVATTLETVAAHRWCDGRTLGYGASYAAHCALHAAHHPTCCGVVALVPALGTYNTTHEPGGVPRLYSHLWWWSAHGPQGSGNPDTLNASLSADPSLLLHQPCTDIPHRAGWTVHRLAEAWEQPPEPGLVPPETPAVPLLAVGGLRDVFRDDTVALWRQWPCSRASMVMGPWAHSLGVGHSRPASTPAVSRFVAEWLQLLLHGALSDGRTAVTAVRGENSWQRFAPHRSHHWAARCQPDCGEWETDPEDPHPSVFDPEDVSLVSDRKDMSLHWLESPACALRVVGNVEVSGEVSATVHRTVVDFPTQHAVRLVLVTPQGQWSELAHTVVWSHREGDVWRMECQLPFASFRWEAPTRLAVVISSDHFPLHPRDPHTGEHPLTAANTRPAKHTITALQVTLPRITSATVAEDKLPTEGVW